MPLQQCGSLKRKLCHLRSVSEWCNASQMYRATGTPLIVIAGEWLSGCTQAAPALFKPLEALTLALVNALVLTARLMYGLGKEYGSGSSRDWAAKGVALLGVRAVIAESYERIHRSNLVGMGVLPLQFKDGENADTLGLTGNAPHSTYLAATLLRARYIKIIIVRFFSTIER